jgi:membrane fusion protein (multidrug efflux system)
VTITLDALPDGLFSGRVDRISPVVDPDTGTFRITAAIDDDAEQPRLRPGIFARVRIVYNSNKDVALLDRAALISEDGLHSAFVIGADDTVSRRVLETDYSENGLVETLSGHAVGEHVVTAGKTSLREGARISVIQS